MRKKVTIPLCIAIFCIGMSVMLYPTVSNWYSVRSASYVVANYQEVATNSTQDVYDEMFDQARAYNQTLTGSIQSYEITEENMAAYYDCLDVVSGVMGYVHIDKIDVSLPIYHGTEEVVLQKGVGHLEGSALPTGDVGEHTILTGHSGLPSAELFTDLDELVVGDLFEVSVLNETFTYEVFDIHTVLPYEVDELLPQEGRNLVTLVTCTPYGVNSHRLLVQGELVWTDAPVEVTAPTPSATQVEAASTETTMPVIPLLCIPAALLFLALFGSYAIAKNVKGKRVTMEKVEKSTDGAKAGRRLKK